MGVCILGLAGLGRAFLIGQGYLYKKGLVLNMRDSCLHFCFASNSHVSLLFVSRSKFCLQAVIEEQQPLALSPDCLPFLVISAEVYTRLLPVFLKS